MTGETTDKNMQMLLNSLKEINFQRRCVIREINNVIRGMEDPEQKLIQIEKIVELSGVYLEDK